MVSVFYVWCHFKGENSSFQKGMTFCRSIYMKKVMKLLAFIFEQPSYLTGVIMCDLTGPLCENVFPQTSHVSGQSPMCIHICKVNLGLVVGD